MQKFDLHQTYRGRRVLVTGHTGFKGMWLTIWLLRLGAEVCGYSLLPPDQRSLYRSVSLANDVRERFGDIRDVASLAHCFQTFRPDIVFHLAGVSTVNESSRDPARAMEVNAGGLMNVLSASRACELTAIICVTSDKCYRRSRHPHKEDDALGFDDPYSSSKTAMELAVAAFQVRTKAGPLVATARSGNAIGGGDWARGRLIPDVVRACQESEKLTLRHPIAVRPWQHVLDVLNGYLTLAGQLLTGDRRFVRPYNFGPSAHQHFAVLSLVELMMAQLDTHVDVSYCEESLKSNEDQRLLLDSNRASKDLGWEPLWDIVKATEEAAIWYLESYRRSHMMMMEMASSQIDAIMECAAQR